MLTLPVIPGESARTAHLNLTAVKNFFCQQRKGEPTLPGVSAAPKKGGTSGGRRRTQWSGVSASASECTPRKIVKSWHLNGGSWGYLLNNYCPIPTRQTTWIPQVIREIFSQNLRELSATSPRVICKLTIQLLLSLQIFTDPFTPLRDLRELYVNQLQLNLDIKTTFGLRPKWSL